jgi:hypothetical protein
MIRAADPELAEKLLRPGRGGRRDRTERGVSAAENFLIIRHRAQSDRYVRDELGTQLGFFGVADEGGNRGLDSDDGQREGIGLVNVDAGRSELGNRH